MELLTPKVCTNGFGAAASSSTCVLLFSSTVERQQIDSAPRLVGDDIAGRELLHAPAEGIGSRKTLKSTQVGSQTDDMRSGH